MGWRGPGDLLDTVITQAQPDTPGAYMSLIIDESTVRATLLQLGILRPPTQKEGRFKFDHHVREDYISFRIKSTKFRNTLFANTTNFQLILT